MYPYHFVLKTSVDAAFMEIENSMYQFIEAADNVYNGMIPYESPPSGSKLYLLNYGGTAEYALEDVIYENRVWINTGPEILYCIVEIPPIIRDIVNLPKFIHTTKSTSPEGITWTAETTPDNMDIYMKLRDKLGKIVIHCFTDAKMLGY